MLWNQFLHKHRIRILFATQFVTQKERARIYLFAVQTLIKDNSNRPNINFWRYFWWFFSNNKTLGWKVPGNRTGTPKQTIRIGKNQYQYLTALNHSHYQQPHFHFTCPKSNSANVKQNLKHLFLITADDKRCFYKQPVQNLSSLQW